MELNSTQTSSFVQQDIVPAIDGLIAPTAIDRQPNGAIVVRGRLLEDASRVYRPLRARFERLGYTPFLRSNGGDEQVEVIAAPGVIPRRATRWKLSLTLFLITVCTVLLTGTLAEYTPVGIFSSPEQALLAALREIVMNPALLLLGVPFAATLLGILFTHEMGHYVVSRLRGAPASLPYFIPMPPLLTITGTMGAVIVQREPFEDRRTLLEVAIVGPLAGLVVAIPLLFYGLATSAVGPVAPAGAMQEGNSIFYALAKYLTFGQWLPGGGQDVQLNAVAWGAWIGLLVTMLNLLPVGQLDGGHVAYALFGRRADYLAYAMMLGCLVLGVFVAQTWLIWVLLIGLMGPRHPAPFNDVLKLRPVHVALGVVGLVTFILLLTPNPLTQIG